MEEMEIIDDYRIKDLSKHPASGKGKPIPEINYSDIRNKVLRDSVSDIFSKNNPVSLFFRKYRLSKIEWTARSGRTPSTMENVALFFRTKNPLRIIRDNYRTRLSIEFAGWEKQQAGRIENAVRELGNTSLNEVNAHTFRIIRSAVKAIDSFDYPSAPDLKKELNLLNIYNHIFSCSFKPDYGTLKAAEICVFMKKAEVSENDMRYQNFEQLLNGEHITTYKLSANTGTENPFLRPVHRMWLFRQPDGDVVAKALLSRSFNVQEPPETTKPPVENKIQNKPGVRVPQNNKKRKHGIR